MVFLFAFFITGCGESEQVKRVQEVEQIQGKAQELLTEIVDLAADGKTLPIESVRSLVEHLEKINQMSQCAKNRSDDHFQQLIDDSQKIVSLTETSKNSKQIVGLASSISERLDKFIFFEPAEGNMPIRMNRVLESNKL